MEKGLFHYLISTETPAFFQRVLCINLLDKRTFKLSQIISRSRTFVSILDREIILGIICHHFRAGACRGLSVKCLEL